MEADMQGWWSVRCGDALAWVEAPSAPQALRRSLDLHPLGDWTDDARELVVFPQDAYPDTAGPHDYTRAVLTAERPRFGRGRARVGVALPRRRRDVGLRRSRHPGVSRAHRRPAGRSSAPNATATDASSPLWGDSMVERVQLRATSDRDRFSLAEWVRLIDAAAFVDMRGGASRLRLRRDFLIKNPLFRWFWDLRERHPEVDPDRVALFGLAEARGVDEQWYVVALYAEQPLADPPCVLRGALGRHPERVAGLV